MGLLDAWSYVASVDRIDLDGSQLTIRWRF